LFFRSNYVENIRTSRRFLRNINPKYDIDGTTFEVINKKSKTNDIVRILDYLLNGNDVGVMSESCFRFGRLS